MRPIDHFFSQLERLERSLKPGELPAQRDLDYLSRDFTTLTGPVIGAPAAADMFDRALLRAGCGGIQAAKTVSLERFGAIAAFFIGEFDENTMELETEDWEDIRDTLEDISEEINIETLTSLMGELLSRGKFE
jgi:hypothetical protein